MRGPLFLGLIQGKAERQDRRGALRLPKTQCYTELPVMSFQNKTEMLTPVVFLNSIELFFPVHSYASMTLFLFLLTMHKVYMKSNNTIITIVLLNADI